MADPLHRPCVLQGNIATFNLSLFTNCYQPVNAESHDVESKSSKKYFSLEYTFLDKDENVQLTVQWNIELRYFWCKLCSRSKPANQNNSQVLMHEVKTTMSKVEQKGRLRWMRDQGHVLRDDDWLNGDKRVASIKYHEITVLIDIFPKGSIRENLKNRVENIAKKPTRPNPLLSTENGLQTPVFVFNVITAIK